MANPKKDKTSPEEMQEDTVEVTPELDIEAMRKENEEHLLYWEDKNI